MDACSIQVANDILDSLTDVCLSVFDLFPLLGLCRTWTSLMSLYYTTLTNPLFEVLMAAELQIKFFDLFQMLR